MSPLEATYQPMIRRVHAVRWALSIAAFVLCATVVCSSVGMAEDQSALDDVAEQEVMRVMIREQERIRRADQHVQQGQAFLGMKEYEQALEEFERAMILAPENEDAVAGRKEALTYLEARGDLPAAEIARAVRQARIGEQLNSTEVERLLMEAQEAFQMASSSVTGGSPSQQAALIGEQLRSLQTAEQAVDQARVRMERLGAEQDVSDIREEAFSLLGRIRALRPQLEASLSAMQKQIALGEAAEQKQVVEDIRQSKRELLLREAKRFQNQMQYEESIRILKQMVHMDPADQQAADLLSEVQELQLDHREAVAQDLAEENRLTNMQMLERKGVAEVSPGDRLQYPKNWDEIVRRAEISQEKEMLDPASEELRRQLERRQTFDFQELPVDMMLNNLRDLTNINIVYKLPDEVKEQYISMDVYNMRTDHILNWIMKKTGLEYRLQRGVVFISTPDEVSGSMTTRVYDIRDIAFAVTDAQEMPQTEFGTEEGSSDETDFEELRAEDTIETVEDIIRNVLAEDFEADGTRVSVLNESGTLIIKNTPEVQQKVVQLLSKLRRAQAIQVAIEARFLRLRDDFWEEFQSEFYDFNDYAKDPTKNLYNTGVYDPANGIGPGAMNDNIGPNNQANSENWEDNYLDYNEDGTANPAGVTTYNATFRPGDYWNQLQGTLQNGAMTGITSVFGTELTGVSNLAGLAMHIKQSGWLGDLQTQWFIRMVRRTEKADEMFSPHLVVYNNRYGWIQVVDRFPYIASLEVSSTGDGLQQNMDQIDVGSSLQVRPKVSSDLRYVTLDIQPQVLDLQRPIPQSTLLMSRGIVIVGQYTIDLPTVTMHTAETIATVPDGGAVLMTGLSVNVDGTYRRGVPLLQDLPILGNAFSSRAGQKSKQIYSCLVSARMILLDEEEARYANQ